MIYKPFLLGINDATRGDWLIVFGFAIIFIIGLIAIAGMIVYFSGYSIKKMMGWRHKNSSKNATRI
jgi:hypothetical protein